MSWYRLIFTIGLLFINWAVWLRIFINVVAEAKTTSNNSTKLFYPNGIHVNLNGTRGHFITKEIEIDQGHSKTKTYRSNDHRGSNEFDRNDRNVYVDSQTTNFDYIPSAVLQPPPISVVDRSEPENTRHRYPKNYWTSNWNSASSEDLNESGNIYFYFLLNFSTVKIWVKPTKKKIWIDYEKKISNKFERQFPRTIVITSNR